MEDPGGVFDVTGYLRYGVPVSEKERLAASASLPGAPADQSEDLDAANRYASGYLFAQQHPKLAPVVQPLIDMLKTSDLPFFGGSSPTLQSYATAGMNQGLMRPKAGVQASALRQPTPQPSGQR